MDILDKYPRAKVEFFSWFMNCYNLTSYTFNNSPFVQQCIAISRCFGYRIDLEDWPITKLEDHMNNILYLYEDVIKRYPDGVPDVLKDMQSMNFSERAKEYAYLNMPADISHGLNEAIVSLSKPISGRHHMKSLHDAIILTKSEVKTVADDYWTADKLTFNSNEKAPF